LALSVWLIEFALLIFFMAVTARFCLMSRVTFAMCSIFAWTSFSWYVGAVSSDGFTP